MKNRSTEQGKAQEEGPGCRQDRQFSASGGESPREDSPSQTPREAPVPGMLPSYAKLQTPGHSGWCDSIPCGSQQRRQVELKLCAELRSAMRAKGQLHSWIKLMCWKSGRSVEILDLVL